MTSDFISNMFIKHNTIIPGSSWQNGLAECNGGWWLGGSVRHDFDLSGLSPHKFQVYVTVYTSMLSVALIPLVGPSVEKLPLRFCSLTAPLPYIVLRFLDATPLS